MAVDIALAVTMAVTMAVIVAAMPSQHCAAIHPTPCFKAMY
jgi:hypothetical protein